MGIPEHWKCVKMHKFYRKLKQQPHPWGHSKYEHMGKKFRCRTCVYIYKIQKDQLYKDYVSKYYSRYGKYDD